jgi:RNA polymerase sigma-70 factor, ECF subfamily
MTTDTDAALLRRAQAGDLAAWTTLCRRHADMLAGHLGGRLCRPDLVELLVSQAMVTGWRNLAGLTDAAAFPAWWRRLAGIVAGAWLRGHPDEPTRGGAPSALTDPAALAVHAAVADLPEADRRWIELAFRGGLGRTAAAAAVHRADDDAAWEAILDRIAEHPAPVRAPGL